VDLVPFDVQDLLYYGNQLFVGFVGDRHPTCRIGQDKV
jgi:hypothetical protein